MSESYFKDNEVTLIISATDGTTPHRTGTTYFTFDRNVGKQVVNLRIRGTDGVRNVNLNDVEAIKMYYHFTDASAKHLSEDYTVIDASAGKFYFMLNNDKVDYTGEVLIYFYIILKERTADGKVKSFDAGAIGTTYRESLIDADLHELEALGWDRLDRLEEELQKHVESVKAEMNRDLATVRQGLTTAQSDINRIQSQIDANDIVRQDELVALRPTTAPLPLAATSQIGTSGRFADEAHAHPMPALEQLIGNLPINRVRGGNAHDPGANTDWDTVTASGFYQLNLGSNRPPDVAGGNNQWWFLDVIRHNNNWCLQVARDFTGVATWHRRRSNEGAWNQWVRMDGQDRLPITGGTMTGGLNVTGNIRADGAQGVFARNPSNTAQSIQLNFGNDIPRIRLGDTATRFEVQGGSDFTRFWCDSVSAGVPGTFTTGGNITTSGRYNSTANIGFLLQSSADNNSGLQLDFIQGNAGRVRLVGDNATAFIIANNTGVQMARFESGLVTIPNDLTVRGNITGALTGNADTATRLQTARNINGVAFDGSADITINASPSQIRINERDLDALNQTGFYDGQFLLNAPTTSQWHYVMEQRHNNLYKFQWATNFSGDATFTRVSSEGNWGSWRRFVQEGNSRVWDITASRATSIVNTFGQEMNVFKELTECQKELEECKCELADLKSVINELIEMS